MRIKALFLRNPSVDVRRAIDETDTFAETRTKEPDYFQIHKIHFLQIEDNRGPGSLDLSR